MAMECPECGADCVVAYVQDYRKEQGAPMYQVRAYVCKNLEAPDGPHAFVYRNSYLGPADRLNAAKFMRQYNRQKERQKSLQNEIEFEEDEDL